MCAVGSLIVLESVALFVSGVQGTLSWHVWQWLGVGQELTWVFCVRRAVLAVFFVWVGLHLLTGRV
jgi:hypothetical protein